MKKNNTFQSYYGSVVGSASLDRKIAEAGSRIDLKLTYRVGKHGIDETGVIKILFRIATDMESAQFSDPGLKNYVRVTCSNKNAELILSNTMGKQGVRPWSRGFSIFVRKSYLEDGDEISIYFSNFAVQTYTEKNFEFRIHVDPFATGKNIEMEYSPKLSIVPGEPKNIRVILPSMTKPGEVFKTFIKVEDRFGNVCTNFNGDVQLESSNDAVTIPEKLSLLSGVGEVDTTMSTEGVCVVSGSLGEIRADSNPSVCTVSETPQYLWADLQGQSEETVGTNSIEDYFEFAKGYGRLDIISHQGNDFQVTNGFWDKINKLTMFHNDDGNFVAFPGYEWSGNSSLGGDHNVIFRREGEQIHRSSHALVNDLSDIDTDASTIAELCEKIDRDNTVLIAHAGGRHANLKKHSSTTFPDVVEIHSDWGTFEWLLREAFDQNMLVGIVANSDGHKGTPGASYPGSLHFGSQGGLTCVRALSLNRDDVFDALKLRHTYATTGARILLDVACLNTSGDVMATAGDILEVFEDSVILAIHTVTTAPFERIEIYKRHEIIKRFYPKKEIERSGKSVKIIYSGASGKGRSREFKWDGAVVVSGNNIEKVEKINFYSESDDAVQMDNQINITGTTTGGCQGVIVHLRDKTGSLRINLNDKEILLNTEDITKDVNIYDFGALDARLEVYEAPGSADSTDGDYKISLDGLSKSVTPYFVKVIQRDGHMAWSSPIYLLRK